MLEVIGAREHNLKNIDVVIPKNKLVVITGLSGSGKSSLAFDTIYAEGQRRYIESFASYARQFLGKLERPDVDKISGLSPVIAIEQKTVNRNPRSTVGTITEIYDFFRLLYAKVGTAYSYKSGQPMVQYSDSEIVDLISEKYNNCKINILAPVIKGRKGHYRELFEQIRKQGFVKARIDGEIINLDTVNRLDRYKIHDIEIVIDRILVNSKSFTRLKEGIVLAMKHGKNSMMVLEEFSSNNSCKKLKDKPNKITSEHYSRKLMCSTSGISYDEPSPNTFSFNSPYGACPDCNGLGEVPEVDVNKIIPDKKLSIKNGGIAPLGKYQDNWIFSQIAEIAKGYNFKLTASVNTISAEALNTLLYGNIEGFEDIDKPNNVNATKNKQPTFKGIIPLLSEGEELNSASFSKWVNRYMKMVSCSNCKGNRLKKESLYFKIFDKNIAEVAQFDIQELQNWVLKIENTFSPNQQIIANEILKEIKNRIQFLLNVGLNYLNLNRGSRTLSGGEAQRIRLATQIGSQLVGVLYILDEPSIGLHQRDNEKLIAALQKLRDGGNSVVVVEHDKEMMENADFIIDVGPFAGVHGGEIVGQGSYADILKSKSLTAAYLNGTTTISIPEKRRKTTKKDTIKLIGASGNNLKNVDLTVPLKCLVCVTGVSGSGKSSLINKTLFPLLFNKFYKTNRAVLPYKKIIGTDNIDKVIAINQSPIGRTPRSNPATYVGFFAFIRELYAQLPESKIRGYKAGQFSFNVKKGRCETCKGAGVKTIEMNFLPDVYVNCEACNGKRYNRETLEVRFKGKSIYDVLEMTIDKAIYFFESIPSVYKKLFTLQQVGLGYVKIGQASTTLSGGEAQRIKLASELSKVATGNTLYILDEPSTGLHFEDIKVLMNVLQKLVNKGNSVMVIEHNLDIIKTADYIIDLGVDGGKNGGEIIAEGTPESIVKNKKSLTGKYLKKEFIN